MSGYWDSSWSGEDGGPQRLQIASNALIPKISAASQLDVISRDAIAVTFDVPPELKDTFAYRQGQYLTLRTTIDGEDVRRSYSICSAVRVAAAVAGVCFLPRPAVT